MSELRRNGGADDADNPVANDNAADKPAERPRLEIRTADMDPERPVNRPLVTKAQRYYTDLVKQSGDAPPPGDTEVVYVKDWATGESLDHKYPPITGGTDRTGPDDPPGEAVRDNDPAASDEHTGEAGLPQEFAPSMLHLDTGAFQDADDGWNEAVAPTDDRDMDRARPDVDDRPGTDPTDLADIPGELDPDRVRSTSMSISEARDKLAGAAADLLPDLHRDNSRLEARTGERTDETWYDRLGPPESRRTDNRFRSVMEKSAEESDEVMQDAHDLVDTMNDLFGPKPPTHTLVDHAPPPADMGDPLHSHAHTPGDAAAALIAGAFALTAVERMMRKTIENRKDRHGSNGNG